MRLILDTLGAVTALALAVPALASPCPANVTDAVLPAHAGAVVNECKQETEGGKLQYEVKITLKDGKRMAFDVDPAGTILLTEEYVELAAVPPAVMTAFTAKFPGAKATKAEKQTASDGKVTYEIRFGAVAAKKEATFTADGAMVEEERGQD
jgi:hypothetical protein